MSARAARIGAATGEAANLVKLYEEAKKMIERADPKLYPKLAHILRRRRDKDGVDSSVAPTAKGLLSRIDEIIGKLNTVFAFAKDDAYGLMPGFLLYDVKKLNHYKALVVNVENSFQPPEDPASASNSSAKKSKHVDFNLAN